MERNFTVITSTSQLAYVDQIMMEAVQVAVDAETDGLSRFRKLAGLGFAISPTESFYVPLRVWKKDVISIAGGQFVSPWADDAKVRATVKRWLLDKKKKWIGHNIQFDVVAIDNDFGVNIEDNVHSDTQLLHHTCISEDPPHNLKVLAFKFLDKEAMNPQNDVKESVLANGGNWVGKDKEMFKCNPIILGKYCCYDVMYTFGLHNLWYPEIEKQGFTKLWHEEVLPLVKVIIELNTSGIRIDVPYFEKLKVDVSEGIVDLENKLYDLICEKVKDYEYQKVVEELTITPRSEVGKLLMAKGLQFQEEILEVTKIVTKKGVEKDKIKKGYVPIELQRFWPELKEFYLRKNETSRVFKFDSVADRAYLLFDVLQVRSIAQTKTGKNAVDAKTLKKIMDEIEAELMEEADESASDVLKMMLKRSKEIKILNTYITPLLENHIDGRVYPVFNQTGTVSGRFSSSDPINFQTLPRDDLRIKAGFIPDEGCVFVNADFSSLEPRCFADRSDEPEIKRVYRDGLDLYSYVYILLFDAYEYSAKEGDPNFLKDKNPKARKGSKEYTLGFAYNMTEWKLAKILNIPVEEAKEIRNRYFETFKKLKSYQDSCFKSISTKYYVTNIMGRKRRAKLIPFVKRKFGADPFNPWELKKIYARAINHPEFQEILESLDVRHKKPKSDKDFAYLVKNEINNSTNFPIQSLAAAIMNASCIEFVNYRKLSGMAPSARLVLQVHDENTLQCKKEDAEATSKLLRNSMENNKVTRMISVPMKADPIITDKSLAEAK